MIIDSVYLCKYFTCLLNTDVIYIKAVSFPLISYHSTFLYSCRRLASLSFNQTSLCSGKTWKLWKSSMESSSSTTRWDSFMKWSASPPPPLLLSSICTGDKMLPYSLSFTLSHICIFVLSKKNTIYVFKKRRRFDCMKNFFCFHQHLSMWISFSEILTTK